MFSSTPPRPPRFVPEDGAENPVFREVDADDAIDATLLFAPPLADGELDVVESVVLAWFAWADWGGAVPELVDERLTPTALHFAVTGVRSARAALGSLVDALVRARLPVARAIFARVRGDGDQRALVRFMDPTAREEVRYATAEEWWRACFDPSVPPPLAEDLEALASDDDSILEIARTTFAERRGMPLHVPGMRICWGLGELGFSEPDARTRDVARTVGAALRAGFDAGGEGAAVPVPYDHRRVDGAIDRIVTSGGAGEPVRVGYSCALHASELREFLHAHLFRYREYELMLALRDAARALDLEPVVCWRRFSGRYVVQLWERSAHRVHAAA